MWRRMTRAFQQRRIMSRHHQQGTRRSKNTIGHAKILMPTRTRVATSTRNLTSYLLPSIKTWAAQQDSAASRLHRTRLPRWNISWPFDLRVRLVPRIRPLGFRRATSFCCHCSYSCYVGTAFYISGPSVLYNIYPCSLVSPSLIVEGPKIVGWQGSTSNSHQQLPHQWSLSKVLAVNGR